MAGFSMWCGADALIVSKPQGNLVKSMKIISSKEVLKNKLFTVVQEVAQDNSGFEIHRAIVRHPGSAVMMAVDETERILLVKQFRLPAAKDLWELPAGRVDAGETALQAAKRELHEETGYRAKKWLKLISYWPSPGYVAEKMNVFLALDLTPGEPRPMGDERIEAAWFTRKQISDLIKAGKMEDGKTLVGYFMWLEYRKNAKKPTRS
jgi:ADP-ribose pyrophosphatase